MPSPTERKLKFNFALSNCLEIQATAKIGNLAKNRYVEKLKREIARGAYPVTLYKRRTTIIFGISGLVQISHIILSYYTFGGGRGIGGEGCVLEMSQLKIMKVVSYFIWLTCLFSFILVEVTRPALQGLEVAYIQAGKSVVVIYTSRTIKPLHRAAASSQQPAAQ